MPDPDVAPPSADPFRREDTSVRAPKPSEPASGVAAAKPQRSTMFFGAMQASRAKLTLIRGDGLDGVSFTLAGQDHLAGRIDCPLVFPDDPFLSPTHANFFYRDSQLFVRDEDSANGVYIRIVGSVDIAVSTRFLVGEQILELRAPGDDSDFAADDGTYYFSSPRRPANFALAQILRGGATGLVYRAAGDSASIGRESNDINFPDDPFISGRHARVEWKAGKTKLTDLGSKNGTFVRIVGERMLRHGEYVFMGQQLLRVEIV